jgi:hypothetical protein
MWRRFIVLISATGALAMVGVLTGAQAPAGQTGQPGRGGPAPGRGGPPAVPLSQVKWETWNNTGLRGIPQNVDPDGPAPRRDLTGIWDPARGGIGARGTRGTPAPLTEWGKRLGDTHKSGDGARQVPADQINDPLSTMGDPGGYPRQLFFELRHVQFLQTPVSVVSLFMWERRWRVIWTDGRQLPADPDPRWYGYHVGRWEDDYTFVVNSNGTDERTWLDNAGNPHSDQLRVEERWHRISEKRMELTVSLNDPKAYTQPWVALDKLPFVQIPPTTDLIEMMNSASDAQTVAAQYKGK